MNMSKLYVEILAASYSFKERSLRLFKGTKTIKTELV